MIDHLVGKPSRSWRRTQVRQTIHCRSWIRAKVIAATQVFLVMLFWLWRIVNGERTGPNVSLIRRWNRSLSRFTPWQLIVSTLTAVYAIRHADILLGLGAPEPLARLYSRSYYRATWIVTALDAGFATAMSIKSKWLRDLCSVLFAVYYVIYANEADETLRKFRAVCTVEMLRVTWEKTSNPYIRAFSYFDRPRLPTVRQLLLPRPNDSSYTRPIAAWLFFAGPAHALAAQTELILDLPGGGFICMGPQHHEERLRRWALITGRPVLSLEYSKAPEYPFPYALEESFDAYRVIAESAGRLLGMGGSKFNIILTGDSAGANLCVTTMIKVLQYPKPIQHPVAIVLNYPALDFNFTSWMTPANMRVLRREQSDIEHTVPVPAVQSKPQLRRSRSAIGREGRNTGLAAIAEQKDHYAHRSPLSAVRDVQVTKRKSWTSSLGGIAPFTDSRSSVTTPNGSRLATRTRARTIAGGDEVGAGDLADDDADADSELDPKNRPISAYVRYHEPYVAQYHRQPSVSQDDASGYTPMARSEASSMRLNQDPLGDENQQALADARARQSQDPTKRAAIGTRLAMTSRTGYFQDRIISPGMMRAMAILYVGPSHNPDLASDYFLSPILAPEELLARFPRLLMTCGEKDPFVDDTVIFCGRVREAKRNRRAKLQTVEDPSSLSSEDRILLSEREDDWVQLEILEGWSHGYLQMSALLPDARSTIARIGEWISEAFDLAPEPAPPKSSPRQRMVKRTSLLTTPSRVPDLDAGGILVSSETETSEVEEADLLMMVPKKRRPSPPPDRAPKPSSPRAIPTFISSPRQSASASSEETLAPDTPPNAVGKLAAGVGGAGRGSGSATPAGTTTPLLAETSLMKRRMDDVLHGLGGEEGH
ncbi:alpha/beta-hydrolase [Auriculariales sp. MPI-PUGE-AT-0066]|nr:alpha/beta-hydrolase [Auriculariales sp. MPI-PUGE-AT-0066]